MVSSLLLFQTEIATLLSDIGRIARSIWGRGSTLAPLTTPTLTANQNAQFRRSKICLVLRAGTAEEIGTSLSHSWTVLITTVTTTACKQPYEAPYGRRCRSHLIGIKGETHHLQDLSEYEKPLIRAIRFKGIPSHSESAEKRGRCALKTIIV